MTYAKGQSCKPDNNMGSYIYKSAIELSELICDGKASSTDIVREHLEQIKRYNNTLNALISIFEDGVQIVGKYWSEPVLISFAKQVAKLILGFVKPNNFEM